ncbi:MAG TPA: flagellar brake protein [Gallionellaceae bacterium]|nr:flagellar brake protein [Gallionellaceae bacterium]
MSREVALTIEKFYNEEEEKFLIYSRKEIQLILHAVARKKNRAILYFDHGKQFIQTMLLAVDHEGIWLDVGPDDVINKYILNSHDMVLVSMHHHAKIQFEGSHIYLVSYAGNPAFYMTLPEKLLRLQRRDYFRLPIPSDTALKCVVPPGPDDEATSSDVTIMDISVGGIALVCKENTTRLEEGKTYPDCRIDLPGIGTLKVTIQVRNMFEVTNKHGVVTKHAGCEFMNLNGQMSMLLQRYIAQMQRQLVASAR